MPVTSLARAAVPTAVAVAPASATTASPTCAVDALPETGANAEAACAVATPGSDAVTDATLATRALRARLALPPLRASSSLTLPSSAASASPTLL